MAPHTLPTPIVLKNARIIPGRSRGRRIGIPTINLDLTNLPKELKHGIYACWISIDGKKYRGAMHFGPRPVFNDTETLEIHIFDETLTLEPKNVDVDIVGYIRGVEDFPSPEALVERIQKDIEEARGMLIA